MRKTRFTLGWHGRGRFQGDPSAMRKRTHYFRMTMLRIIIERRVFKFHPGSGSGSLAMSIFLVGGVEISFELF